MKIVRHFLKQSVQRKTGWTLTELLCVMAIISILLAMYLGVIARAFVHIIKFLKKMGGN
jgi:prepilin-type N-terminal cleavage/methylation domain-containing protein